MLYPSVGVLSFRLEMSECNIDWVVESQLKCSQSSFKLLSQPNNNHNHNPNNKTTKTCVGLRLNNRWETTTQTQNCMIGQYSENKSCSSIWGEPKTFFEPNPDPKNSPLGPQKLKNEPKIKSNSNVRIEGIIENESCLITWDRAKNRFQTLLQPPNQPIRAPRRQKWTQN